MEQGQPTYEIFIEEADYHRHGEKYYWTVYRILRHGVKIVSKYMLYEAQTEEIMPTQELAIQMATAWINTHAEHTDKAAHYSYVCKDDKHDYQILDDGTEIYHCVKCGSLSDNQEGKRHNRAPY